LLNHQVKFKNWYMLVLSQYHKFESYKINIYSARHQRKYLRKGPRGGQSKLAMFFIQTLRPRFRNR
jgi:hypothetical protein